MIMFEVDPSWKLIVTVGLAAVSSDIAVFADIGQVRSTVEINSTTVPGPELSDGDRFGSSIATIGDLNEDGVQDIAVGAIRDDEGGNNRGAMHIIMLNTDGSAKDIFEINSSTENGPILDDNDEFGFSVSGLGDLNDDGVEDIVVGAHADDAGGSGRGAVHIMFLDANGSPVKTVEINSLTNGGPALSTFDNFGSSVANIGDLNGDGVQDIAVGAPRDDEGGADRGAVHIILLNNDGTPSQTVEINSNTSNGPELSDDDRFGHSVVNIDDLNLDGVQDIAVGAIRDDEGGNNRGAVHIVLLSADGTPKSTVEINSSTINGPVLDDNDEFAFAIASLGDLDGDGVQDIVVGAHGDDEGGSGRGTVHVIFLTTDGAPKSTVEVNSSTANGPMLSTFDNFGASVASLADLDGDGSQDIAVGAPRDDAGGADRGALHLVFLEGCSVFCDGFESSDTNAWSNAVPDLE